MIEERTLKIIAHIRTDFDTKFGLPRQSGMIDELKGYIVFEKEFRNREALRGIEEFDYLWLLWEFSEAIREEYSPTVRPPKLGGNERVGVYATRSPFRPNPIGLSVVRLEEIIFDSAEGPVIKVSGIDMMDGTPIYDIKPYISYADSKPNAQSGFVERTNTSQLKVELPEEIKKALKDKGIENDKLLGLEKTLSLDPRPSYKEESDRVYGFSYAGVDIKFTVNEGVLKVVGIE